MSVAPACLFVCLEGLTRRKRLGAGNGRERGSNDWKNKWCDFWMRDRLGMEVVEG